MLSGKKIVLGVTGGIAAYKAVELTSRLIKLGAKIKVIMTPNALNFVQPLTFETLSGNPVYHDTFGHVEKWELDHISLAKWADLFVVAPATANILGKVCSGIADDLLSTTIMATPAKVLFAPAMNTGMYTNPIVQRNIRMLKDLGYGFIAPAKGRLACGDIGEGKLADVDDILDGMIKAINQVEDLKGIRVLVTAGPTREYIDPVRFISNPSSGKMGYAIAAACLERGAVVDLITGPVSIEPPAGANVYKVETAFQMYEKVMELFPSCQMVIKSAAVGDYKPAVISSQKIKKESDKLVLELVRNPDILKELGQKKENRILIGFAAETENLEEYAKRKITNKNLDFIFANQVSEPETGFERDTNQGILFTRQGESVVIPLLSKKAVAHRLMDEVLARISISDLKEKKD